MTQPYKDTVRSTFLVYPIARVGRSLEFDRLRVLIFGVISIVKLDGLGLGGDRPSIITVLREHPQRAEVGYPWQGNGLS